MHNLVFCTGVVGGTPLALVLIQRAAEWLRDAEEAARQATGADQDRTNRIPLVNLCSSAGERPRGRPLTLHRGVKESPLELTGSVRGRVGAMSPSIGSRRTSHASPGGAAPVLRSDGPTARHRCRCIRLCHDRRPQGSDSGVAWPAGIWPRSTRGRPYAEDSLQSGAARFGRIDRRIARRVELNRPRSFRRSLHRTRGCQDCHKCLSSRVDGRKEVRFDSVWTSARFASIVPPHV